MIQSYLLITNNKEPALPAGRQITEQINILKSTYKIISSSLFEFTSETSVGIDLVRKIKSLLINKNTAGYRLIIVYKFETATEEAQNAFLKLLEEPPSDTMILLVAKESQKILPTVFSRCHLIKTNPIGNNKLSGKENLTDLMEILKSSPGKRLQIAGNYNKNKNDALNFLNSQVRKLGSCVYNPPESLSLRQITEIISKIESARRFLEANVSSKGVVDVLFLGL